MRFKFKLGQNARIINGIERGTIVGVVAYVGSIPQYKLRYKKVDGQLHEEWWNEDILAAVSRAEIKARERQRKQIVVDMKKLVSDRSAKRVEESHRRAERRRAARKVSQ